MKHNRYRFFKFALYFAILMCEAFHMTATAAQSKADSTEDGFAISRMGPLPYGTNGVGIWLTGKIQVGLSDTLERSEAGVGVFENRLAPEDLTEAKDIHRQLCAIAGNVTPTGNAINPPISYSVNCSESGSSVVYRGRVDELPAPLCMAMDRYFRRMNTTYINGARAIVKFEVKATKIEKRNNRFYISVEFANRGDFPVTTSLPSTWKAHGWDSLRIIGRTEDEKEKWEFDLTGALLSNSNDFKEALIVLKERSSVTYVLEVAPNIKVKAGAYNVFVTVFMGLGGEGPVSRMGRVDFHSDYDNPEKITIDSDYPSTPQEWREYEARKAKEVSFLKSGATVATAGYYRAVSVFGPRAPFVKQLNAGDTAPKLDSNHWDRWEWEADLARATTCKPGELCPRDGRWVLRSRNWNDSRDDFTYSAHERRIRSGEALPVLSVANISDHLLYWEWLAA